MPLGPRPPLPTAYPAPSSGWQFASNVATTGASTTVTSGNVYWAPFDVLVAKSYNALGVSVNTAQVAGTTTTTLAVYKDDGTGGAPSLAGGTVVSATLVMTSTGNATTSVTWAATPGRWWLAFLYSAAVAPTTVAQIFYNTGASLALPLPSGGALSSYNRGWLLTGQSSMPTSGTLTNSTTVPLLAAKAV